MRVGTKGKGTVNRHSRQVLVTWAWGTAICALIVASCSGNAGSTKPGSGAGSSSGGGNSGSGGVGSIEIGRVPAGAGGAAECLGNPPLCRGTNVGQCCAPDPYGSAICQNGTWTCRLFGSISVAAPGCDGQPCELNEAGASGQGGD